MGVRNYANDSTFDVVALGELLIDFTPHGLSEQGLPLYERNPGGAPANVLAALAKLGRRTAFIGAVGDDAFGRYLSGVLDSSGIDTDGLVHTAEAGTTLAFVHLDESGDRSFTFYRQPGADHMLRTSDIDFSRIASARVFHFGSLSMTHEPSRTATLEAASHAKRSGVAVSYDPNLRLSLWDSADTAKERILEGMRFANIVKLSEEELLFLTGTDELERGTKLLMEQYPLDLLLVTRGAAGSYCRTGKATANHAGYKVDVADTTGAGDAFLAGILYQWLNAAPDAPPFEWTRDRLEAMLAFANAMGALAASGKGAIPSMPAIEQVLALQAE